VKDLFGAGTKRGFYGILGVAFLLRLLWIFWSPAIPASDAATYDLVAQRLVAGEGYVLRGQLSAYWPVGYPAFLAAIYRLAGHDLLVVKLLQAVLSVCTIVVVYKIGALVFNDIVARLATLMLSFSPNQIAYVSVLMSEVLFTFLLAVALYLWALFRSRASAPLTYGWVGIVLALACYVRPIPLLLPGLLFAYDLCAGSHRLKRVKEYFFLLVCMGLAIAPWTLRNWKVLGHPIVLSTNGGINFLMGNNPNATGKYQEIENEKVKSVWNNEVQRERVAYAEGIRFVQSHPGAFVRLALKKMYFLFHTDWDGVYENFRETAAPVGRSVKYSLYFLCQAHYLFSLGLFCLSWLRGESWQKEASLLWLVLFYWVGIHMVIVAEPRYHFPIMPIIYVLAASSAASLIKASRSGSPAAARSAKVSRG
jgi:4-amino-4-deoxy-L-arabinose transferase-like glycosyltransferase